MKNKITIISGDKDFTQLINKKIIMLDTMKNRVTDDKEVLSKYGLKPEQMIDYFSLVGDSIDNIPGVRGIGPKPAQSLIDKFKTLDNINSLSRLKFLILFIFKFLLPNSNIS